MRDTVSAPLLTLVLTNVLIAIFALAIALTQGVRDLFRPAATFAEQVAMLDSDTTCPGGQVRWYSSVDVLHAPAVLSIARTIWNDDAGYTVQLDNELEWAVYSEPAHVEFTRTYTVPSWFVPGRYEIRVGTQEAGRPPQVYRVPFTVRECEP